ncbi:FAD-dependent oxidoreductase [Vacuolonema iberomarrocanum]|uniref:FAD-dependent oxidoreductase n=1 Tax=Vacuolonema iberomarrocanum TaxID=3454632 RepID=UPI0019E1C60A|nr:FAD-dependent oxidoreductase [filamentous cyanobacterium LEGE 07170]
MALSASLKTHRSFWIASTLQSCYPALVKDLHVDVAIIGGGLAGITAAMLLKKAGKRVAVLEAGRVAEGVSGHTTAKVTSLHHLIYASLLKDIGEDKARLYGESNQVAIEKMAALVRDEQIDCDFTREDAYTFAEASKHVDEIVAEAEAAKQLSLPASFVTETPLPFPVQGAVKFSNQAQFHPRKYILCLADKVHGDGSDIFENTRVKTVEGESPCQVQTENGYTVTAQDVIVTTHLPILDQGLFFAKTYPKRSYLIGARIDSAKVPDGMFIGMGENYHSIRAASMDEGGSLLLIGGEGHKVGEASDTEERYQRLATYARERFGIETVDFYWSSQDTVSFDKLPYIGRLTPMHQHTYVATGFSLWGMSKSTLSAMILSDLILGQSNSWANLYDATRPTPFVTQDSIKNNLDVGVHWVGDRFKGLFDGPEKVRQGEGRLVTISGKKIAAYRDESGELHQVSAVCPHLGCIVDWNAAEKSWDCPCHGSRFSTEGDILHEPAVHGLALVPDEVASQK